MSTTEGQALLIFTANTISHGWLMALHEGNRKKSLSKTRERLDTSTRLSLSLPIFVFLGGHRLDKV